MVTSTSDGSGDSPLLHLSSRLEHVGASLGADAQVCFQAVRHMLDDQVLNPDLVALGSFSAS